MEKVRITPEEITPRPLIEVEVEMLGEGNKWFKAVLEDLDDRTDKEYQRIITQNRRRQTTKLRDKDIEAAALYLIRTKLKETNIDWNIYKTSTNGNGHGELPDLTEEIDYNMLEKWGYKDEIDFFTRDREHAGLRYAMAINNAYWRQVRPDTDSVKD